MAGENTHNCSCVEREEIELHEGSTPAIVLIDEDCCDCECNEIELYSAAEPDILLFEEYAEQYIDDIVATKETADAIKAKTDLIPSIKTETDKINDIKEEVCGTTTKDSLRTHITKESERILNSMTSGLEECSKKDVEQMFDGEMWDDDWMWLPSMDIDSNGWVALNIEIDSNGWAHFVDE